MPLTTNSLVWYKASESSNNPTNGGRLLASPVTDAVKNNLFPDVSQAERAAGATHYRKLFMKVDDATLGLQNAEVFIETASVGDDVVTIFPATKTDTQASITGTENQYGMGTLQADVLAGASAIVVTVEDWTNAPIFHDGDKIRITDAPDVNTAGTIEYATIATGGVSAVGNDVTLTLTAPLANGFLAGNKVSSVLSSALISATAGAMSITSAAGTYNEAGFPIVLNGVSTIDETWTLTFTTTTAFDIVGAAVGAVGSGSISTGASPSNGDYSLPYFTVDAGGFGGSFTAGDTISFTTSSATYPVWMRRFVPAGAVSLTANSVIIAVEGESA